MGCVVMLDKPQYLRDKQQAIKNPGFITRSEAGRGIAQGQQRNPTKNAVP
jgi:hypothetical protein